MESWKGNASKSFGIETNIGIHFFDMLSFLFGQLQRAEIHYSDAERSGGFLEYKHARVKWFLSISKDDIPLFEVEDKATYRSIKVDGQEIEFSTGFTDLHTVSYRRILDGEGFGVEIARPSVEAVSSLRNKLPAKPKNTEEIHKGSSIYLAGSQ